MPIKPKYLVFLVIQITLMILLKAVYYTVEVHNFDLQEKTTENNNNAITAKWVKPEIVIELTNCKMYTFLFFYKSMSL